MSIMSKKTYKLLPYKEYDQEHSDKARKIVAEDDIWGLRAILPKTYVNAGIGEIKDGKRVLKWTLWHEAAKHNAFGCMHELIFYCRTWYSPEFNTAMNPLDENADTPAMVAAKHNSDFCLWMLLNEKSTSFYKKNNQGLTIRDICQAKSQRFCDWVKYYSGTALTYDPKKAKELKEKLEGKEEKKEEAKKDDEEEGEEMPTPNNGKVKTDSDDESDGMSDNPDLDSSREEDEFEPDPDPIEGPGAKYLEGMNPQSKTYALLKKCIKEDKVWSDKDFPANINSICKDKTAKGYETYKSAAWHRPHEFMGCEYKDIKLFDNIEPNDIQQGYLGTCYFLCTLSAISEYPNRIKKLFVNKVSNPGMGFTASRGSVPLLPLAEARL